MGDHMFRSWSTLIIKLVTIAYIRWIVSLSIIVSLNTGCQKCVWTAYYYDSLRLDLLFDPHQRLVEFALLKPHNLIEIKGDIQKFDSLVVPGLGALGLTFNISLEQAKKLLGLPKEYSYLNLDTCVITMASWKIGNSDHIDLYFKNDSLERIKSNTKRAKLPKDIFVGTPMKTVILLYGKPSLISSTKEPPVGVE